MIDVGAEAVLSGIGGTQSRDRIGIGVGAKLLLQLVLAIRAEDPPLVLDDRSADVDCRVISPYERRPVREHRPCYGANCDRSCVRVIVGRLERPLRLVVLIVEQHKPMHCVRSLARDHVHVNAADRDLRRRSAGLHLDFAVRILVDIVAGRGTARAIQIQTIECIHRLGRLAAVGRHGRLLVAVIAADIVRADRNSRRLRQRGPGIVSAGCVRQQGRVERDRCRAALYVNHRSVRPGDGHSLARLAERQADIDGCDESAGQHDPRLLKGLEAGKGACDLVCSRG